MSIVIASTGGGKWIFLITVQDQPEYTGDIFAVQRCFRAEQWGNTGKLCLLNKQLNNPTAKKQGYETI